MHHNAPPHGRSSSRTWIQGCYAAALVGLASALLELPFHQTSAAELGVVTGLCLTFGVLGSWSATPRSATETFSTDAAEHVPEASRTRNSAAPALAPLTSCAAAPCES